jgi:threonylcarbamoyladenosine tRNA methylthiotransferase MtaB
LEVTDNLIQVIADSNGRIAPHIHLSAQSAEDVVLKRMARRHHVKDFEHVCHTLKRLIPHASLGSDIIVGFPGETPERFESTYHVLNEVPMDYFHVFSYSKRKGTPAASFEDQVPEREKKERARRLISLSEEKHQAFCQEFMGKTLQVIVEESLQKGMSENYLKIYLDANGHDLSPNDLVEVQVESLAEDGVNGCVISILCPAATPQTLCSV